VRRLQRNIKKHLKTPHRFVCLTNLTKPIDGIETIALTEGWPGWWSKIEFFKPGQFNGPVLSLDLDLMICGSIDKLAGPWPGLVMLRDCPTYRHVSNSGLMYWNPAKNRVTDNIFNTFKADPFTVMKDYSGINGVTMFGDQGFIEKTMIKHSHTITKWQDVLPPAWFLEFSYRDKINPIVENNTYDKDVRVCYSLGYPKFNNMPHLPIVKQHWEKP